MSLALPRGSGSTWPLTVTGMITLIAHLGLIAGRYPRRTALPAWLASALLVPLLVALDLRGRSFTEGVGVMILYPILSVIVLGTVLLRRRWKGISRELADARHDVEVEQSQRAVAEERTRIARELHDVVAHGMSVIHMQATSASYRISDLSPEAKAEFARIATDARSSLREMRQLLAVLRDESADAELAPVPGLNRLAELVESADRAGVRVRLESDVEVALPDSVALAAYRIVQESLSNVIRHAPGARTVITIKEAEDDLVIVVENDEPAQAAQPAGRVEAAETTGQGLRGMRERVRLVGGSLETGERGEGGYRVEARLPTGGRGE
jgi:signal transduction histidine kinase